MNKFKLTALIFAVMLCLCSVLSVSAESELPRLTDDALLLTAEEVKLITEKLDEISESRQMDVVIHTTLDTDGYNIVNYADDFYDYNGYGFGENYDGCMLLISVEDRDWYITTCGSGQTAFTEVGIDYIGDEIKPYLSSGDYYSAFSLFCDLCDDFIYNANNGTPYNSYEYYEDRLYYDDDYDTTESESTYNWFYGVLFSLTVGVGIGLLITFSMKSKLKSVRSQPAARDYLVKDSMHLTQSKDIYLYRNVSRVALPKESSSSGSRSHSSSHTSSSGRSHGGGGGHF